MRGVRFSAQGNTDRPIRWVGVRMEGQGETASDSGLTPIGAVFSHSEETEAWGGRVTWPRSPSKQVAGQDSRQVCLSTNAGAEAPAARGVEAPLRPHPHRAPGSSPPAPASREVQARPLVAESPSNLLPSTQVLSLGSRPPPCCTLHPRTFPLGNPCISTTLALGSLPTYPTLEELSPPQCS